MKRQRVTKISSDFGLMIRDAREEKEMRQDEVAKLLGIGQSYYSLLENGKREIDLALSLKICTILEIDIRDFAKSYMGQ